ncbi:MAG TPA: hypothetical protein VFR41_11875 [Acidimicrobiia bacterium]|nr:hypothetical protein [Acidimicrobiia bacterium]
MALLRYAGLGGGGVWHTPGVSAASDQALLSSVVAQVEDLAGRVTALAEQYGETPDSAVAAELYAAERALVSTRRSLDRVRTLLDQLPA